MLLPPKIDAELTEVLMEESKQQWGKVGKLFIIFGGVLFLEVPM